MWGILALCRCNTHIVLARCCDIYVVANHVRALVKASEEDVDKYVDALRDKLKKKIAKDKILRVNF